MPNATHSRRSRAASPAALCAALFMSAMPGHASGANDWPMFRGPNGQGILDQASIPLEFGPSTSVLWKTELPPGHSSPILSGPSIFLTGVDGDDLVTIALDRATGRERWRRTSPRPRTEAVDHRSGPAAASPVTDGQTVVSFFGDYGLIAYGVDGSPKWQTPMGPFNNIYGMGASPVLVNDLVVLAVDQQTDSYLAAVSLHTGERVWTTPRPEAKSGHSTPVLVTTPSGQQQILVAGSFRLTGYAPATGEQLWWISGLPFEMKSTPAIEGSDLFIHGYGSPLNDEGRDIDLPSWNEAASGDNNDDGKLERDEIQHPVAREWLSFVDLDGDGSLNQQDWEYLASALRSKNAMIAVRLPGASARGDLTEEHVRWRYGRRVPQLPSPLIYRGALWMVNDRALTTVLNPENGRVLAQGRIDGLVDSVYASPVGANGWVLIVGRSGKIAVLDAEAAAKGSLKTLAVSDLDETIVATPAIDEQTLYIRTKSALYAFRAADSRAPSNRG